VLPDRGPLAADLERSGAEVIVRPLAVLRRQLLNPRGLAQIAAAATRDARVLRRLIAERDVALVHSNTSVLLGGAAGAALARIPHVWHVREIYDRFGRAWPPFRRLLQTARALPCVSQATAGQFAAERRATVIHDGLAITARRAERAAARAALGIESDQPVIAVLGRISDWKGQDVLVKALAQPALRERQAIALLAGDPWPGAEERLTAVLELAENLGVGDRVRHCGFRDDVENVYGAADVIAVPSTEPDPLPNAAIEAAAAGCAVVASAHGGLPEIIRDPNTGRLVRPADPAALATASAELLDSPDLRAQLGGAAAQDVRERFDPARMHAAIADLYGSLLR
jgi:glycosyltransferase involved in cell wall biosynthesis